MTTPYEQAVERVRALADRHEHDARIIEQAYPGCPPAALERQRAADLRTILAEAERMREALEAAQRQCMGCGACTPISEALSSTGGRMTLPPSEDRKLVEEITKRVEEIVRDHFYPGPVAGSTARLAAALIAEFDLTRAADALSRMEEGEWRLVPREPTEAMVSAGASSAWSNRYDDDDVRACYRAMLSAAPSPPQQETGR